MRFSLYALHGFLGLPSDWDEFERLKQETEWQSVNLFDPAFYAKEKALEDWAKSFNQNVQVQRGVKRILLGYSLGARLGMHALLDSPKTWDAAILVSANLGLQNDSERVARQEADLCWAKDFRRKKWRDLLAKWDSQTIFKGIPSRLKRDETAFSRDQLADALGAWSVSNQQYLKRAIESLPIPLLWIVGQKDERYARVAQTLHLKHPLSQVVLIPGAAHRVPWEKPLEFESIILHFLKKMTIKESS